MHRHGGAAGDSARITGDDFLPGRVDLSKDLDFAEQNLSTNQVPLKLVRRYDEGADQSINRPRVNIYIGDVPIVAIGGPSFEVGDHGALHATLRDDLNKNPQNSWLIPQEDDYVAGFEDGNDIILRIDVPKFDKNKKIIQSLTEQEHNNILLERYRKALLLADSVAISRGGRVTLETNSKEDIQFVMMLGELHRVVPRSASSFLDAKKYIQKCTESIAGGEIFAAPWGSRFKSATQIEKSLTLLDNPQILLEYISGMHHTLSPERTSRTAGVQEAVFLVINPDDGNFNESFEVQSGLYDQLTTIKEMITERIDPTTHQWIDPNSENDVKATIELFISEMRSLNHSSFRYDDLNDPIFTRTMNRLLRGKEDVIKLGEEFSTPQKAIDIGRFVDGQFHFSSVATDEQKAIANFILDRFAGKKLEWLCLCTPLTPLTPEQHPSQFISRFGNPEDESYVLLFKEQNGNEQQVVIRRHPFGRSHWEKRILQLETDPATAHLAKELKEIGSENLVRLVNNYHKAQTKMYNRLAVSSNLKFDFEIPCFDAYEIVVNGQVEDIQMRPFIDGDRVDFEKRIAMQKEEFLKYGTNLGAVSVPNFLAQRPNASLHELLVVKRDSKGHPEKINSIGTSESFSNSFGAQSAEDFLEIITPLYGGNLASWLATFRYGEVGSLLDVHEIRSVEREFLQNFKAAFIERYREIQSRKDFGQSDCAREYQELINSLGISIPDEFNPIKNINITEKLLEFDPEVIADKIIASARDLSYCYTNVVEDIQNKDDEGCPLADRKEDLIKSVCAVISNHCNQKDSFSKIHHELLSGSFDYSEFSMTERQHLLIVADISALLDKISPKSTEDIYNLALNTASAEDFVIRMNIKYGNALFQEKAAAAFHAAINGLKKDYVESEDSDRKEKLQKAVSKMSFGTFNLSA